MVVETAYLVTPSQAGIVTIGFKLTAISAGSSSTQYTGVQTRNQHIVVFLFKDLERTRKAIVEESKVNPQVIVVDTFPSTHGAHPVSYTHLDVYKRQIHTFHLGIMVVKEFPSRTGTPLTVSRHLLMPTVFGVIVRFERHFYIFSRSQVILSRIFAEVENNVVVVGKKVDTHVISRTAEVSVQRCV